MTLNWSHMRRPIRCRQATRRLSDLFTPSGGGPREQQAQSVASVAATDPGISTAPDAGVSVPETAHAASALSQAAQKGRAGARSPDSTSPAPPNAESREHPAVTKVNAAYAAFSAQPPSRHVSSGAPSAFGGTFSQRLEGREFARDVEQSSRITREDLAQAGDYLIEKFQQEAYANAMRLLAENERITRSEASRYSEISSGDPRTEANELRKAAASLAHVQRMILRRYQFIESRAMARAGGPQYTATADKIDFYMENSPVAQRDPLIASELYPRLEVLRRIWGVRFPILLQEGQDYSRIADASPDELAEYVADTTDSVLRNIASAREKLTPDRIWEIPMLVSYTKATMGIPSNQSSPAQAVVDQHAEARGVDELLINLLLGALGLVLAVGAVVASAGAATPAAAAAAGSLFGAASAVVSVVGAVMEYKRYTFRQAQAGSSLDPARALSRDEPSFLWLAVVVVGAIADLGAAAMSFRTLVEAAKLRSLIALKEAAHAQASVLLEEGELAIDEGKFVERVMSAAEDNVASEARRAEEPLTVALDRELEAQVPNAAQAAKQAAGAGAELRRLVTDLRAHRLDADAIRRVFAEAGDDGKVKGQLLEELFAVRAREALKTPEGIARYARGGPAQGLEFIEPHRIADSAGRKFTDGLFGVVDRERRTFTVANIVEAKAGEAAKAKLSREAARLKGIGEEERAMLRETAIDELLDKYHPVEEGTTAMFARQNRFRHEVATHHADEIQELMEDLYQQGEPGQVRRTIERSNPSVDINTGADIPATVKIDGIEYKILGAHGSTPVTAVLPPSDVGAGRLASTIAKQGLNVSVEKMGLTTQELDAIALAGEQRGESDH